MVDNNSFQEPTKEFIENSLTFGLSENLPESQQSVKTSVYSYSDIESITRRRGRLERKLIQFALNNKRKIKRVPLLGKFALYVKRRILVSTASDSNPYIPILDLSEILGLDINDFIWQLYILALGRPPDSAGMENYKIALSSGASKEAIIYIVCTSHEFAGRANVAHLDEYRKKYRPYRLRKGIKGLPVIGWILEIAAMPGRINRLEIDERIRYADSLTHERHQFDGLSEQMNAAQHRLENLYSETSAKFDHLSSQIDDVYLRIEEQLSENTELINNVSTLSKSISNSALEQYQATLKQYQAVLASLETANQNITFANVKLDKLEAFIPNVLTQNRPFIYGLPGGTTVVQMKEFYFAVPSEEWRLAIFLNKYGYYELGTEKYFRSIIKAGMNVLDVGANLGIYTLHALTAGCHVYSYEPTPNIYNILMDNIGINGFEPTGRANAYNLVVSDMEGEVEFIVYDHSDGQSNTMFAKNVDDPRIKIKAVYLDKHLEHLDHIDVVKIDVEGAEPLVLKGMKNIIAINGHIKIIMEFAPVHLKRGGVEPAYFIDTIHAMDFDIRLIDDITGELRETNVEELCNVFSANVLLEKTNANKSIGK